MIRLKPYLLSILFLGWSFTPGCTSPEPGLQEGELALSLTVQPLTLDAQPGSGEPNLVAAPDGSIYVTWIEPISEPTGEQAHVLRMARYAPAAAGWTDPQTIAQGTDWFVNWADVPSLAVHPSGRLAAHWLEKNGAGTYAYGIRFAYATDAGTGWNAPEWLHDDNENVEHGFTSLVPIGADSTLAVWLDGRNYADGVETMTLRARVHRPDGSFGTEVLVDDRICDCCPTSAVRMADGSVVTVYRDRTEEEIRDIYAVRYHKGAWSNPVPVYADDWEIAGCPVNGPAVDAQAEQLVVAWFTGGGGPRVNVAFSMDHGVSFGEAYRVDLGQGIGRVDVAALDDGTALVSWVEGEGDDARLLVRRVAPDGTMSPPVPITNTSTARSSGFPRMVRSGNTLVWAWTHLGEEASVETAVAAMTL